MVLEESNLLDSRVSALDEDLDEMETDEEEDIIVSWTETALKEGIISFTVYT